MAGVKGALRVLAQSRAHQLAPQGVQVAHTVIGVAFDTEFMASHFPERDARKDPGGILDPEAIAEAHGQLHQQPRNAWTQELDLRPWMENW